MKPRRKFEEEIFFSTVRITIPDQGQASASVGTGFLFEAPVGANRKVLLLISNKHVYGDPNSPIVLNFHKRDPNDPNAPILGETVTLSDKQFTGVYYQHPDPAVDLACINVSNISNTPGVEVFYRTLRMELICDLENEGLHPGIEVWFVGYPENRFDTSHNLPILRRGYIASIPRVNFEGQPQLLIDAQVFPGSSGSPVFVPIRGDFLLLGVVTQTMIRNQKLQTVPTATAIGIQQMLGLGIVLKAHLVRELVDSAVGKVLAHLKASEPEPTQASEGLAPVDSTDV